MNEREKNPSRWVIGFAGHRNIENPTAAAVAIREVILGIQKKHPEMKLVAISSVAAGADILFLEICETLAIPFDLILPFPIERFHEDFSDPVNSTGTTEWSLALGLIASANSVRVIDPPAAPPQAYRITAREVLAAANEMIFLWDGKPPRGVGGTGETVADARAARLGHTIIDSISLEIRNHADHA